MESEKPTVKQHVEVQAPMLTARASRFRTLLMHHGINRFYEAMWDGVDEKCCGEAFMPRLLSGHRSCLDCSQATDRA